MRKHGVVVRKRTEGIEVVYQCKCGAETLLVFHKEEKQQCQACGEIYTLRVMVGREY